MDTLLVTGGCGFIGANFIRYLFESADFTGRVVNLDALTYAGNPESLADIADRFADRYRLVQADIRDAVAVRAAFADHGVDAVCHFAAESHVDRSIAVPDAFITTNIIGTFNLLEAFRARKDRMRLFHHVSTDEVFGSLGPNGLFSETTAYAPSSPYSASKAGSDHLVRAYHHTYGIPVTLSNCSNNYGPYQFPEKLIPLLILNALEDKPLPIYGDGRNVRDWLYVTDHCQAIWSIMTSGKPGETYAVGGRCERSNRTVATRICEILAESAPRPDGRPRTDLITFVADRPGHDFRYAIDSTKIETTLGWTQTESFESGMRKTIAWYRSNPSWVARVRSGEYRAWMRDHYGVRHP